MLWSVRGDLAASLYPILASILQTLCEVSIEYTTVQPIKKIKKMQE
jgi:hypothetical protein